MSSFPRTLKDHQKEAEKILSKIDLSREELERMAVQFANDTSPIRDITCPREVRNPGLYFGFMKAVKVILGEK